MFFGFILLFSSLSYVADLTNYLFFNDEPCIDRPTIIIYLNPVEHRNYPFMISLNKCTGSCNVLSPKKYVPKKHDIFHVIANTNLIVQHAIQNKNGIIKHVNVNAKSYCNCEKKL